MVRFVLLMALAGLASLGLITVMVVMAGLWSVSPLIPVAIALLCVLWAGTR